MYEPAPLGDTITLRFFFRKRELKLARRCLKAMAKGDLVSREFMEVASFPKTEDYAAFLQKFDGLQHIGKDDLRIVQGAVWFVANHFTERKKLEKLLGVRLLYVGWFSDKLRRICDEWDANIEYNARLEDEMW